MKADRLILPLAAVGIFVSIAALFGLTVGLGFAVGWIFMSTAIHEGHRRRREERERRHRIRLATWQAGDRR